MENNTKQTKTNLLAVLLESSLFPLMPFYRDYWDAGSLITSQTHGIHMKSA
jgi:hypothetical protein